LIDEIDTEVESIPLSVAEGVAKKEAYDYLAKLRREVEASWV
jgi:hypothetical protein